MASKSSFNMRRTAAVVTPLTLVLASYSLAYNKSWDQGHQCVNPTGAKEGWGRYDYDGVLQGEYYSKECCELFCEICPVYAKTGLLHETLTDLSVPGTGPSLAVVRTYLSQDWATSLLGKGWMFSYGKRLISTRNREGAKILGIRQDTGEKNYFKEHPDGTLECLAAYGVTYSLSKHADGTYTITERDGSAYALNAAGKIASIIDKNGNALLFNYDAVGCLSRITNASGNYLDFQLGPNGKIASISDNLGRTVGYTHDDNGNLIASTDPMGYTTQYTYDSSNRLTQIIDARGNTVLAVTYDTHQPPRIATFTEKGETWTITYHTDHTVKTGPAGETWTYYFNESGILSKVINPLAGETTRQFNGTTAFSMDWQEDGNGNRTTYTYDADGNTTSETDPLGNTWQYTYLPGTDLLESSTDPLGIMAKNEYDASGNRTRLIRDFGGPSQRATTYTYDSAGNLATVTDALGNTTTFSHDGEGHVISRQDPLGNITTYTYDSTGHKATEIDALGNTISYTHDPMGRLLTLTDALGNTTTYAHDENGNLTSETDIHGNVTTHIYDGYNRRTGVIDVYGNPRTFTYDAHDRVLTETDSQGNTTTFSYDAAGRLVRVEGISGETVDYTHDASGNVVTATNDYGETITYSYDALNRLQSETNGSGQVRLISYGAHGRKTAETDFLGNVTSCGYDRLSNLTSVTDPLGGVTAHVYDAAGNRLVTTDANGNSTISEYDALGRVTSVADAAGRVVSQAYDSLGNVTQRSLPNGNTITYSYTDVGQLVSETDSNGVLVTYAYDTLGRVMQVSDPLGNSTSYAYDGFGRLEAATDPLGGATVYTYDSRGNILSVTNRDGHVRAYAYDPLGQLVSSTDPLGNTTTYTYVRGERTAVTDARGNTTQYAYDRTTRTRTVTYADGRTMAYVHGPNGKVIARTDQNGNLTGYQYDAGGRLIVIDYPGANDSSFSYDAVGNVLTAVNQSAIVSFAYDSIYRHTLASQNGRPVSIAYDSQGDSTVTYPSGRTIRESRDRRGNLIQIDDNSDMLAAFTYGGTGKVASTVFANGVSSGCIYNANQLLSRLTHVKGGGSQVLRGYEYSYNGEGRVTAVKKTHRVEESVLYQYDPAEKLIQVTVGAMDGAGEIPSPQTQTQYNLDALYNWTSVTRDGVTEDRTHNEMNELIGVAGTVLQYVSNGNLTADGERTYEYDPENRLVRVRRQADGVVLAEYLYDALGRRVGKTTAEAVMEYVYDDRGWLVAEYDSGGVRCEYVYGHYIDQPVAMIKPDGSRYFYLLDRQYSVVALTGGTGNVVESYDYVSPYGTMRVYDPGGGELTSSSYGNALGFTGRQWDSESELWYFRNRTYADRLGRFVSHDASGYTDGLNLYAAYFVPDYVDPYGLWKRIGRWTGSSGMYAGTAEAECILRMDAIEDLAELITGHRGDASVYGGAHSDLKIGDQVGVGPLLTKLEQRLRDSVVGATTTVASRYRWLESVSVLGSATMRMECHRAVVAVMALGLRGLLKDDAEFHRIYPGWAGSAYRFSAIDVATFWGVTRGSARRGDWGYI